MPGWHEQLDAGGKKTRVAGLGAGGAHRPGPELCSGNVTHGGTQALSLSQQHEFEFRAVPRPTRGIEAQCWQGGQVEAPPPPAARGPRSLSPPLAAGLQARALGGGRGYWDEEAICVEMNVSMTPWLEGSRWLWPGAGSELWYSTRLLDDTVGLVLSRGAVCRCCRPAGS